MRLIDADIFASELDFADTDVCEEFPDSYCEFGFSREKIRELLRDIPTVDAVPVVRCRDCKFGDWDSEPNDAMVCMRTKDGFWRSGNDFCSYGRLKEHK